LRICDRIGRRLRGGDAVIVSIKRCYWADFLRTPEESNIIALLKEMMVLGAMYGASKVWSFMDFKTLD
jgi:phage host-nuclease inhibitor protein Gam